MIWPVAASLYILVGGIGAIGVARSCASSRSPTRLDLTSAFALICGCIVLWPVLLALAIDQDLDVRRKNDHR